MHSLAWWPVLIAVAIATATDIRWRRIPNWLVFPFLTAGVAVSAWRGGWHGTGLSLSGLALGLVAYGILFWMGGMGAGDVKLAAAIGAWIGPEQLILALIFAGLVGGLMALGWAAWGGFLGEMFESAGQLLPGGAPPATVPASEAIAAGPGAPAARQSGVLKAGVLKAGHKIPYAPAIAIGTLISFFAR